MRRPCCWTYCQGPQASPVGGSAIPVGADRHGTGRGTALCPPLHVYGDMVMESDHQHNFQQPMELQLGVQNTCSMLY